jgi:mono/diheme cytochrome c family protein
MMNRILLAALLLTLSAAAFAAVAGDSVAGKRLHDTNCTGCHDSSVYTRKDRQVHSLDELKQQLQGCSHMAKKQFSATETQNLIKYLNDQFYRFP